MPDVPVVTLSTPLPASPAVEQALRAVCTAIADAIGAPAETVWAHHVQTGSEWHGADDRTAAGWCPVVIVRGRSRDEDAVRAALTGAAIATADALRVPVEDVWLQWVEVAPGHAFAGGAVVER